MLNLKLEIKLVTASQAQVVLIFMGALHAFFIEHSVISVTLPGNFSTLIAVIGLILVTSRPDSLSPPHVVKTAAGVHLL